MASQMGQDLSHKADEVTNQAQMKRDEYKDKASETTHQAQMKKEEYKEGASEAAGQAQVKKDESVDKASTASESTKESTVENAQNYAYELKDQASAILQQTGEQVKNMAQGAAEAVKSTLGINDLSSDNNAATSAATSATNPPTNNPNANQAPQK